MLTATPARIRRSMRPVEYARVSNATILANRPEAQDGYAKVIESFFDSVADAQVLLNERAVVLQADRSHEAIETVEAYRIGVNLTVVPNLPRARAIDQTNGFDKTMLIKGLAIDLGTDRNSLEVIG